MRTHPIPHRFLVLSATACGFVVAAGCTLQTPQPEPRPMTAGDAGTGRADGRGTADGGAAAPQPELELDPVEGVTYWERAVVTGRGPSRGTVVIEEHHGSTVTAEISSGGSFCAEVALVPDTENRLTIQALDRQGRYSQPIDITVVQEGEPPDSSREPTEMDEPENVALGAEIERTSMKIASQADALSDGETGTYATLRHDEWSLGAKDWVILRLPKRSAIDRIVYQTTTECVSTEYKVMLSDADDPAKALEGKGDWSLIEHVTPETAGPNREIEMEGPAVAGFIGLHLIDSGYECRSGTHQIREVQAWSPPTTPGTQPKPSPPSCTTAAGTPTD